MAARLNPKHDLKTREKIKTSQLINRLMKHVNSKDGIMNPSQVRAAEILLKKTLPDIALIAHAFDFDGEGKNLVTEALKFVAGSTKGIPDTDIEAE